MCGFIGVINSHQKADPQIVGSLSACLKHRGPNESATFSKNNYAVAHHRLRILDLTERGRQPMQNANQTVSLAYNGEIYNSLQLKESFHLEKTFPFHSRTDTEVLLNFYQQWGIECLSHLNGMFAFAIWDEAKRKVVLARDRFGIKPLFYCLIDGNLWFASEIKSLLKAPGFQKRVNSKAIYDYLSFDYIPGEQTAFEGIKEVRPGHYLEISWGDQLTIHDRTYWEPRYGSEAPTDLTAVVNRTQELFKDAVRSQLISDVPVGVMLSGGMDSSAIVAMMAHLKGNADFHTFSLQFEEESFDESIFARAVHEKFRTQHHYIPVTAKSVAENLETYLQFIDEPYADGSAIPTYLLSQQAKEHVTVLLSGEGGDEVFCGYETYKAYIYRKSYRKISPQIRSLLRSFAKMLPVSHEKLSFSYKMRKFTEGAENETAVSHYKWREVFSTAEKKLLMPDARFPSGEDLFAAQFESIHSSDELNRLLGIDCSFHLPDDLMIKNDRMTMAHSLEARVPFTDLPLFEYLAQFSGETKMHERTLKWILREAMKPFLPAEIIYKKKVGLEIPYSYWLCHQLKGLLDDYLSPASLKDLPFVNPDYVQEITKQHLKRKQDRGRELWGLINLVAWYRLYF